MLRALIVILFAIAVAIFCLTPMPTHPETTEGHFQRVSKECAAQADRELDYYNPHFLFREKCRRIDFLHDELTRCGTERISLRRAAMCEHHWNYIGPGVKGCAKCASIAHFLGGEWQVVYCDGIWVGPDPMAYPEEYNLGPRKK